MSIDYDNINLRQQLFAFRNGLVAEKLRKSGDPHDIILGCLLPDIALIAKDFQPNSELAQALWNDKRHRECRLISTMLYPPELMDETTAMQWCHDVENQEVADILCLKLLRHVSSARQLWRKLVQEDNELIQYTGYRLLLNLLHNHKENPTQEIYNEITCRIERASAILKPVLLQILEEV